MTLLSSFALGAGASIGKTSARPNVILILSDDQAYGDLACHGNPHVVTPNLDRLDCDSVRFTSFQAGPLCSSARGSLMTGGYNYGIGVATPGWGRR